MSDELKISKSGKRNSLIFKDINFNGTNVSALIDTGCDVCLMRYDTLMMLSLDVELSRERRRLVGIGSSELTTLGSFTVRITIDNIELDLTFHVTRERDIKYALVIGNNVLTQVNLIVTEDGAEFRQKMVQEKKQSNEQVQESIARGPVGKSSHAGELEAVVGRSSSSTKVQEGADRRVDAASGSWGHIVRASCLEHVDSVGVGAKLVSRVEKEINKVAELTEEFKDLCLVADVEEVLADDIDLSHLNREHTNVVRSLVRGYNPVNNFKSPVEMKILLLDDVPVYERSRRLSYADRQIVENQVQEWLNNGIIQPSTSDYASPVVLVPKKYGGKRLRCDYRRLNSKIVRDNFPMAMIDDVIERLQGANVFTTLDLKNGFFHVPVHPNSQKYTSFVTYNGQYEFLYVPFGISNSPAVFTRFIFAVLRDLINDGTVVAYMDDLVIPSKDDTEGILKLSKCCEQLRRVVFR